MEIPDITAEEVREIVQSSGVKFVKFQSCSVCGLDYGYKIHGEVVAFDTSCACAESKPRLSSFQVMADHHNRQSGEWNSISVRQTVRNSFAGH